MLALAFIEEAAALGRTFQVFLLVLLPTLLFLGIVTFERALQTGIEAHILVRRVNRLRRFYTDFKPGLADYLTPSAADGSPAALLRQQLSTTNTRWQTFLSAAWMVAVVNSIIIGVLVGVVGYLLAAALLIAVPLGAAMFLLSVLAHFRRYTVVWSPVIAPPS